MELLRVCQQHLEGRNLLGGLQKSLKLIYNSSTACHIVKEEFIFKKFKDLRLIVIEENH